MFKIRKVYNKRKADPSMNILHAGNKSPMQRFKKNTGKP